MTLRKLICLIYLISLAIFSHAQEDDILSFRFGRPEHVYDKTTPKDFLRAPKLVGSRSTAALNAFGSPKIPVILAQFADIKFTVGGPKKEDINNYYKLFFNGIEDGTGIEGNLGSIRSYFAAQSDSAFLPQFDILGPITLSDSLKFYGRNGKRSKDENFNAFTKECIQLAQKEFVGEWDIFDNNTDGVVDMVFIIFAGLGENNQGGPDAIWPKEIITKQKINGITYACFGCTSELRPTRNKGNQGITTTGDGIGVAIHELSHALGLPDFYHTREGNVPGMDLWSIMDYGEYAGNGHTPIGYTAYERDFMGWQPLKELKEPSIITLLPFAKGGCGYKVVNEYNTNEYYILENRQPIGWDYALKDIGGGLLVTHVDYNASAWHNNSVNNDETHQRMTFIPASNSLDNIVGNTKSAKAWMQALSGHLYPGTTHNYNLTNESSPASVVYTGGLMNKPIRNIKENTDSSITLCFRTYGQLSVPILTNEKDSFFYSHVDHARNYVIEIYEGEKCLDRKQQSTPPAFTLSSLPQGRNLRLRIKAKADSPEEYLDSEWSEWLSVTTTHCTLPRTPDNLTEIYDLQGNLVLRTLPVDLHSTNLPKGIYISKGRKIFIK